MRASLLASAMASTLWCNRFLAASSQGLSPWRSQLLGLISTTHAAWTNRTRRVAIATLRYLAEDGAIPSRDLLGDEPEPSGKVATFGECIPGANRTHHRAGDDRPDPRDAHQPFTTGIPVGDGLDLARQALDALIEPAPVASQVLDDAHHAWRQDIGGRGQDARQLGAQEALSLPHGDAALQQECADLIDDASALAHQSLTHPMQRLQVERIGGLRRHELHRWPLHRLCDRFRVAEVVLLSLRIRANVLRRHHPHDQFEEGVLRHRTQRRAGMGSRGHSYRGLLPRLAGVAHAAREAR